MVVFRGPITRLSSPDLPDQPAAAARPQREDAVLSERAGGRREGGGRRGRKVSREESPRH